MTTNMMSCDQFTDALLAYLEHETDDATRATVERHSVTCADCGALLADLRKLRIDAANLPELQPARDLWSGIASRIEAPVVSIGVKQPEIARAVNVRLWASRALIAASLVAAAGVGYAARGTTVTTDIAAPAQVADQSDSVLLATTDSTPSPAPSATLPGRSGGNAPAIVPVSSAAARPIEVQNAVRVVATVAADYDREIARLQKLIDERRNQLDPVTVGVIEKNLSVIDTAIAECKKAIANDPASGFLIESLNQSLRSKVELMRTAALLPSRT
jgi:anti-sigma factor RsiW